MDRLRSVDYQQDWKTCPVDIQSTESDDHTPYSTVKTCQGYGETMEHGNAIRYAEGL